MTVSLSPNCDEIPPMMPSSKRDFNKRFSVPRQMSERRVTIRPYESFRDRKDSEKPQISFGFAALSTEGKIKGEDDDGRLAGRTSPNPSIFSIYGVDPGPSTICEQSVGAQADVYIASLGERNRHMLKKFLENSPREENQYFIWIRDEKTDKFTVISIKTLENHLKSTHRVRRVKWKHLSSDRVSVYRYSIPAITSQKSKILCDCVMRRKKMWMLGTWLSFILFLCIIVVLGSLNPDDRTHPYLHYNNSSTQLTLQALRNISMG